MQTKVCTKCGEEKEITEFHKQKRGKFGVRRVCKVCQLYYKRHYYKNNREDILESQRYYYKNNREDRLKYGRNYYKNNREDRLRYGKNYYKNNREGKLKYNRDYYPEYYKKNSHKRAVFNSKRRASKLNATPGWLTPIDNLIIKHIYETCPEGHHVDHIVPLRGNTVSGLHVPWNLQHLSAKENISKGNRWWPDMWEELDEQAA